MKEIEHFVLEENIFNYLTKLEVMRAMRYRNYVSLLLLEASQKFKDDARLKELAQILREEIRTTDIVGRINLTRFGVILLHADPKSAHIAGERVLSRAKEYFHMRNNGLAVSIGGACCPGHGTDTETLTSRAETMLAQAKAKGGNIFHFPAEKEEL